MKTLSVDGLHVEDHGGDGPPLLLSHGLLWSTWMWGPQVEHFRRSHRVVAWDHRGQGRSEVPSERAVTIERNTLDALRVMDALGIERCRFVGLSMGGMVGARLAARFPERIERLGLLCTAADPEPHASRGKYMALVRAAKLLGVRPLVGQIMPILFGPDYLAGDCSEARRRLGDNSRSVTRSVVGVIEREGIERELVHVRCPTAVLSGDHDAAISRERMLALHRGIQGSTFTTIPRAGHTMTLENPAAVNAALDKLLA